MNIYEYNEELIKRIEELEKEIESINQKGESYFVKRWQEFVGDSNGINEAVEETLVFKELKEKMTWLSDENAKLYTQVDEDALKRANLEAVLKNVLIQHKKEASGIFNYKDTLKFYERQLKKLGGNPTLGDGIPVDARFPATDSKPESFESYTILEEDDEKRIIQCNKTKINCKHLDENNQCSYDDVDSLECIEREGGTCYVKEMINSKSPEPVIEPSIDLWEKNTVTVICPYCYQGYYLAPRAIENRVIAEFIQFINKLKDIIKQVERGESEEYEAFGNLANDIKIEQKKWEKKLNGLGTSPKDSKSPGSCQHEDFTTRDDLSWICNDCGYEDDVEPRETESLEPCKKCKFWIPNINKLGCSYCHELDFKMIDLPEECIHSKPKDKQHLTLKGAISFLRDYGKCLVYTKEEIKHLVDAFLKDEVIILREELDFLLDWSNIEEEDRRYAYNQTDPQVKWFDNMRKSIINKYGWRNDESRTISTNEKPKSYEGDGKINGPRDIEYLNSREGCNYESTKNHQNKSLWHNDIRKMFFTEYRAYKKYKTADHLISLIYHYFNLHRSNFPFTINYKTNLLDSASKELNLEEETQYIFTQLKDIIVSHPIELKVSHEAGLIFVSNEEFNLNSQGSNYKELLTNLYSKIIDTIELFSNLDTKNKFSEDSKEYRENFLKTFKISRFKEYFDRINHFKEVYGKDWELYANADKEEEGEVEGKGK